MVRFYRLLAGVVLASLILVGCVIPAPVVLDGSGAVVTRERISESARERISESARERISESARERISESARGRRRRGGTG